MTEDATVTIAAIRTLVAERQRFDDWLSALDARKGETPARVFERVRGDYVARRDAVVLHLHQHVGTLESLEKDLTSQLQNLESQLAEREDERAEAMLRTAVGEFDSERWENARHEVEASLAQLSQQRESLLAEAEDTRTLLASARHRPVAVEPKAEAEPLAVAAPPAPLVPEATVQTQSRESAGDDIEAAFAMNDAEAEDVINQPLGHHHEVYNEAPAPVEHAAQGLGADVDSEPLLLDSAPGATAPESLDDIDVFGEPSVSTRANNGSDSTVGSSDARPSWTSDQAPSGTATRDAFDDLAFLRSVTETGATSAAATPATRQGSHADHTKTLRCTECGTMNFPTEWYCERCGGELAAF